MMKVVKRAFDVIRLLKHFEELPLKRMAAALGITGNSAWNLLHFLCESGYAEKVRGGVYRLGPEFQALAGKEPGDLREALERELPKLSKAIKETSVAVKLRGGGLEVVYGVNFERDVMVSNRIYEQADALYCWASGHVLLAWQAKPIVDAVVAGNGLPGHAQWPGVQTFGKFNSELARIRDAGFAERFAERTGICSLAVPVFFSGGFAAALGVSYPGFRNTPMHRTAIMGNLRQTALALSKIRLGVSRNGRA